MILFLVVVFSSVESRERKSKDRVNDVADLYCCYGKRNNEYLAIFNFYDTGTVTLGVGVMVKKYVVLVFFYDGLFCKV